MSWALFVERAWPKDAGQFDAPLPHDVTDPQARRAHFQARMDLADLRKTLYPEDD